MLALCGRPVACCHPRMLNPVEVLAVSRLQDRDLQYSGCSCAHAVSVLYMCLLLLVAIWSMIYGV